MSLDVFGDEGSGCSRCATGEGCPDHPEPCAVDGCSGPADPDLEITVNGAVLLLCAAHAEELARLAVEHATGATIGYEDGTTASIGLGEVRDA